MFYANRGSNKKIFHASDCSYIKDSNSCISFPTEEDARAEGYRQCDRCAAITKEYLNGNAKIIKSLCKKYHMTVKLYDGKLYVFKGESGWMLTVNQNGKLILFHRNERSRHNVIITKLSAYHRQKTNLSTVEEYLRYILYHESLDFQEKRAFQNIEKYAPHGQKCRKGYYKKRKALKRKFGISRTIKLLNELNKKNGGK